MILVWYECKQPNSVDGYKVHIYAWHTKNNTGLMTLKVANLLRLIDNGWYDCTYEDGQLILHTFYSLQWKVGYWRSPHWEE